MEIATSIDQVDGDTSAAISGTGCQCECRDPDIPAKFLNILPPGYTYHLCDLEELPGSHYSFSATLRVNVATEERAVQWVEDFKRTTSCTWRVAKTFSCCGKYVTFKKAYRCQHNTCPKPGVNQKRKTPSKNTNCPTRFTVTVKNTAPVQPSRNKTDKHLPELPAVILFHYQHNHDIRCADALKHRDVSTETTQKLTDLFHRKYGPTAAWEALRYQLRVEHGDNYDKVAADRAIFPDIQYCCRLYQKVNKEHHVDARSSREEMLLALRDLADRFNAAGGKMAVDITDDGQLIAAICTPLMQRVHTLHKDSSKLCVMDASSNLDRHKVCKVFLLLAHSCVGGLPLGVLITTLDAQSTIASALNLYKTILPAGCFGGRDAIGPQLFITDDCLAERQALKEGFPQSTLLLCPSHLLQAAWRWLWKAGNKIPLAERPGHLPHVRRMIFASSEEEADSYFASSMTDPTLQQSFKDYLQKAYDRRSEWACSYRTDMPLPGIGINNFCEASVRVLKDGVLSRTKAYNIVQLADFVSNHLQDYYEGRILDVANGRLGNLLNSSASMEDAGDITEQDITKISEADYKVVSHSQSDAEHHVNTDVGCCTCYIGRTGGPCKHRAAVTRFHSAPSFNEAPLTKQLLTRIATGSDGADEGSVEPTVGEPEMSSPESSNVEIFSAAINSPEDQLASQNLPQATTVADAKALFKNMCDTILDKIDSNPDVFLPAVQSMLKRNRNIRTDRQLTSALHSFGKNSRAALALQKGGRLAKKRDVKRLQLVGTQKVGAQPTATERRSPRRGAKRLGAG